MQDKKVVIASAPATIAIAGDTSDIGGKGATLTLAIEGPNTHKGGGLRAYASVASDEGEATVVRVEGSDELTADTLYGTGRLLELAGYADRRGLSITLHSTIPPRWGLGGAAAELVALLFALDTFYGRERVPEELAETVQRATLRPGQAHGYQKSYGATFGGVRSYGFSHKLTGLWGKGVGGVHDEPYAMVSEARGRHWVALGVGLLVALPSDLHLISGAINETIARRYREEDPDTVASMDRRAFTAQLAHQRLIHGDSRGLWALVDVDTTILDSWQLITPAHRRIMERAKRRGANAVKPTSTGGAVVVYCARDDTQMMRTALEDVSETVYLADIAEGVRLEQSWPGSPS